MITLLYDSNLMLVEQVSNSVSSETQRFQQCRQNRKNCGILTGSVQTSNEKLAKITTHLTTTHWPGPMRGVQVLHRTWAWGEPVRGVTPDKN